MEEENVDVQQPNTEEKKGGSKFLLYSTVVFVQLVAAVVLVKFLLFPMAASSNSEEPAAEQVEETSEQPTLGETFKIDDLTINPKNSMGRRFGVFEVILEIPDKETLDRVKKFEPILRDKFITYFSSKTMEELATPAMKEQSKLDIKILANDLLGDETVRGVYYTRYVLQ